MFSDHGEHIRFNHNGDLLHGEKIIVDIIATKNRLSENNPYDRKELPNDRWKHLTFYVEDVQDHGARATSSPRRLQRDGQNPVRPLHLQARLTEVYLSTRNGLPKARL